MKEFLEKLKLVEFRDRFFSLLVKKNGFLLFIFFLLVLAYSAYLWYSTAYNYSWDENKKLEYIQSKSTGENFFSKARFDNVVHKTEKRKTEYQNQIENPRDIFGVE